MSRRAFTISLLAALLSLLSLSGASAGERAVPANALVRVAFNKTLERSILVDARGFTLYMYSADLPNKPACYDDATYHCSKAWPPLLTRGKPRAGAGVKASLLSTAKRTGGALQVQYRGHPLYTNAGARQFGLVADKKPGDVNGQRFLEIWWVLSPAGTPIRVRKP